MYSVIIQNKKTTESFNKFYPLFLEAVNDKKVGLCRWMESGTTVETALPELSVLTDDKPEWRAIIIRLYDETDMGKFSSNPVNPFDFDIPQKEFGSAFDNSVPLIRLTQILGGMPAPAVEFEPRIEEEFDHKAPRMVFTPVVNAEVLEIHRRITDKFYYNGKHPSEIILISLRKKVYRQKDDVKDIWQNHNETNNSEFWKRNCYPNVCRFIFYEMERQGPVIESADMFKFWASIMMLAVNKIDPNALQAYKLYRFNVQINKDNMKTCFQQTFNRLISARIFINGSIRQDEYQTENIDDILPEYEIEVPVYIKTPKRAEKATVDPAVFGLFAGHTSQDLNKWNNMKKSADDRIKSTLSSAEQSLDMTADKIRDRLSFSEGEKFQVDKYQAEDIKIKLDETYNNILRLQSELPKEPSFQEEGLQKADKSIREKIYHRITKRKALGGYIVIAALAFLMAMPAVYLYNKKALGSVKAIVFVCGLSLIIPAVIELLILLYQRRKLRKAVLEYKNKLNSFLIKLHINISSYSKYMSDIASHARGSSFLRTVQRQKLHKENTYAAKQKHIKDINLFIAYINEWGRAFYNPVEYNEAEVDSYVDIDTALPSNRNSFYTFDKMSYDYKMSYQVQLNNSGDILDSPVDFIDRLIIEREELYDVN